MIPAVVPESSSKHRWAKGGSQGARAQGSVLGQSTRGHNSLYTKEPQTMTSKTLEHNLFSTSMYACTLCPCVHPGSQGGSRHSCLVQTWR